LRPFWFRQQSVLKRCSRELKVVEREMQSVLLHVKS
jgi:hypothetical protein